MPLKKGYSQKSNFAEYPNRDEPRKITATRRRLRKCGHCLVCREKSASRKIKTMPCKKKGGKPRK